VIEVAERLDVHRVASLPDDDSPWSGARQRRPDGAFPAPGGQAVGSPRSRPARRTRR
jgi:hypothetical protein